MAILGALLSLALILLILLDAFEAMIQPRLVTHRFRYSRLFFRSTWTFWRAVALRIPAGKVREAFLGIFGPLSMLGLFATWLIGLIVGFGLLHWFLGTPMGAPEGRPTVSTYLYFSGVTFFTVGYGEVTPTAPLGRALSVAEAGLGFGFMAVIIGYLPVLYQAYSSREATISLLDARAGSPPSAAQFALRVARSGSAPAIDPILGEWERWAAELLGSHLSFPVLSYYRSQHGNQSWLGTLTLILDTSAFLIAAGKSRNAYQAQLTFAMARHAAVDLALVFGTPPRPPESDRLPADRLRHLREQLRQAGFELPGEATVAEYLAQLRGMYEPFVQALAHHFLFAVPPVAPGANGADNWQKSAWQPRTPQIGSLPGAVAGEGHFD
jgi:hypothetical protein